MWLEQLTILWHTSGPVKYVSATIKNICLMNGWAKFTFTLFYGTLFGMLWLRMHTSQTLHILLMSVLSKRFHMSYSYMDYTILTILFAFKNGKYFSNSNIISLVITSLFIFPTCNRIIFSFQMYFHNSHKKMKLIMQILFFENIRSSIKAIYKKTKVIRITLGGDNTII